MDAGAVATPSSSSPEIWCEWARTTRAPLDEERIPSTLNWDSNARLRLRGESQCSSESPSGVMRLAGIDRQEEHLRKGKALSAVALRLSTEHPTGNRFAVYAASAPEIRRGRSVDMYRCQWR